MKNYIKNFGQYLVESEEELISKEELEKPADKLTYMEEKGIKAEIYEETPDMFILSIKTPDQQDWTLVDTFNSKEQAEQGFNNQIENL